MSYEHGKTAALQGLGLKVAFDMGDAGLMAGGAALLGAGIGAGHKYFKLRNPQILNEENAMDTMDEAARIYQEDPDDFRFKIKAYRSNTPGAKYDYGYVFHGTEDQNARLEDNLHRTLGNHMGGGAVRGAALGGAAGLLAAPFALGI